MAYDPSLGKTSEDFRFIFFLRETQEKNEQKGPVPQVSGRLCEAKPEAKSPWSDSHVKSVFNFEKKNSPKAKSPYCVIKINSFNSEN